MPEALTRIRAVAHKEVRQLRRDRLTFGMIIGLPLLQMILFGYAINLDVRHLPAGVVDHADTALSRALIQDVQATQVLDVMLRAESPEELENWMRRGRVSAGIVIPHDFERRVLDGDRAIAQLLVDGSDPTIEGIVRGIAQMPVAERPAVHAQPRTGFEVRTWYNPERRAPVNIVPALIGVILNLTMVLFTAVAIVRERERGNLELLITTPVRTSELMVGKILPYILIGYIQLTLVLLVGQWLFDVPLRGSAVELYLAAFAFIAATLALGLLISTLARSQFQAMQLTVFTFLPSILLSGFMFPFDGMPRAAQWIAEVLPLTHFVRLVRGIVLRGAGLSELMPEILALTVFFVVVLALAVARFHKRLD